MAAIDRSAFCDATGQDDADFEPWVVSYLKLAVVCMAAWRLAALVVRLPGKFIPRGTGLLIAGLLASIAGMIFDRVAKVDVMMNARTGQHNRLNIYFPINYMCMSFIAYATGAQLVMKNFRGLGKRIIVSALCVSSSVLIVVGLLTYVLLSTHGARFMRFNALIGSSATSTPEKMDQLLSMPGASFSIAVMIGGIFTSRSPASAISIVAEMRANGPFTKMALGGTCVLYVVSNIIFPVVRVVARSAMAPLMASACGAGGEIDVGSAVGSFLLSMLLTVLVSVFVGKLLYFIIGLPIRSALKKVLRIRSPLVELYIKCAFTLLIGFSTFLLKILLTSIDVGGAVEFKVEPLLVCLLAAMFVVNHREQKREAQWKRMCAVCAPYIYCVFFALAGSSVNFAAIYESQFAGPVVLVCVRILAVVLGTSIASLADRSRPRLPAHRASWMNFITQAGVALSFAQEVLNEPSLPLYMRSYIYTLVVASVFINQLIGPPLFKIALRLSGEAFIDRIGGAQLVSVEGQAPHIEVKIHSWETRAGVGGSHVAQVTRVETSRRVVRKLRKEYLQEQLGAGTEHVGRGGVVAGQPGAKFAFLSMLEDDAANFDACQLMKNTYNVTRTIVHQSDASRPQRRFKEIGAFIVDEESLVVGSLDQFFSSAQAVELLLHRDSTVDVIGASVGMEAAGLYINQLRLPRDVQLIKLRRHGCAETSAIVPTPFTKVQYQDLLTLCGTPASIAKVTGILKGRIKLVNVGGKERTPRQKAGIQPPARPCVTEKGRFFRRYSPDQSVRGSTRGRFSGTELSMEETGVQYLARVSEEVEAHPTLNRRVAPAHHGRSPHPLPSGLVLRHSSTSTTASSTTTASVMGGCLFSFWRSRRAP